MAENMTDTSEKTVLNMSKLIENQKTASFLSRIGAMLGISHDGKRSLYDIYGYDQSLGGTHGFRRMYAYSRRQGIANRLTWGFSKSCWRDGFEVFEDKEKPDSNVLVDELLMLQKRGLNKKLEQADILNRIGRFSVLLVGVPDGRKLSEEVGPVKGDGFKSLYFKSFAYDGITINSYEKDEANPRFDLPLTYTVQRGSNRGDNEKDNSSANALIVHWSRIIHLNENALDSEIEGMGALEPIFNRILDLDKACGGSAEAYFRNAKGKIATEIDKDFAQAFNDPDVKKAFNEGVEKFTNEFQDHITAAGGKVKTLPTPHASPLDTVRVLLWEISGYSAFPMRILTGEGAGQLAGSEDQLAMNQIIADRQRLICSPWVWGVLEILEKASMLELDPTWSVIFPQQKAATEIQQAEINNKNADTLKKIVDSKSAVGGDGMDLPSALEALGLGVIKTDEVDIDNGVDIDENKEEE